ncbi:MAG: HNH endonuclease [Planctomycetes bacterium]|nr:HNH endonuclease [Planctomycetota bacterium]
MLCPYCGKDRPDGERSREHVVPQAIGGGLEPVNPFILEGVCKRCNSAAGHYIDGPFLRSWFIQNSRHANALRHVQLNPNTVLPLGYNGQLKHEIVPGLLCDYWRGPTGDSIFHFHVTYPESTGIATIGLPTNVPPEQMDPGFAFLFLAATNPVWHLPIVNSVMATLPGAELYLGNGPPGGPLQPIPEARTGIQRELRRLVEGDIPTEISVAKDYGDRFLAKLALGIGALRLAPEFVRSDDAKILRDAMWQRDSTERAKLPVVGTGFLESSSSGITGLLHWPQGHLLVLKQVGRSLSLCPVFFGQLSAVVQITSTPAFWRDRIDANGAVFAIAPGLRRVVGPVDLATFIAARQFPDEVIDQQLTDLFRAVESSPPLPRFHASDGLTVSVVK